MRSLPLLSSFPFPVLRSLYSSVLSYFVFFGTKKYFSSDNQTSYPFVKLAENLLAFYRFDHGTCSYANQILRGLFPPLWCVCLYIIVS